MATETHEIRNAEIFDVGTWRGMGTGADGMSFTDEDLDAIARDFQRLKLRGRVPLKYGHTDTPGQPALGWVSRVWRSGSKLMADFAGVPHQVYESIRKGFYKFVSVELLPDVQMEGQSFPFVLSAVALLGADRPAVSGLKSLQELLMARRTESFWAHRAPLQFSREGDDGSDLRIENALLKQRLVAMTFASAIRAGKIAPAEQVRFTKHFGASATIADAEEWIASAPPPPSYARRSGSPTSHVAQQADGEPRGEVREYARPDAQLTYLAKKLVVEAERLNKTLTFSAAKQVILNDPAFSELAGEYMALHGSE